jgi:S-adenosylmethionine synthetase
MALRLFTSESVTPGHPDKICDQISDSILDALIAQDPEAHVAVETMVTTGLVHVAGEVSTTGYADIPGIVRDTIRGIGYVSSEQGFDGSTCGVSISVGEQSREIADGVGVSTEARGGSVDPYDQQGAGDQGLMFGYAVRETPELMPIPIALAHRLSERLTRVRQDGSLPYLRPDGKTQVTIGYDGQRAVTVEAVVVSTQHASSATSARIHDDVLHAVIEPVLAGSGLEVANPRIYINPSGRFEVGGPNADAGLTGRKIIVDTYGGASRHGGGAFSGKDPSKVDRSGAYAMRWVAKNAVAAGLADRLELQVAYAIGSAAPVGLYAETFGTGHVPEERIVAAIREVFDLRPAAIIDALDLRRPIYRGTAAFGHFGRELPDFTWERTDRAADLAAAAGL